MFLASQGFLQARRPGPPEGPEVAAEALGARPAESSTNTATLRITDADGNVRRRPLTITTLVGPGEEWRMIYAATPTPNSPGETVTIERHPDRPTTYQLQRPGEPARAISGAEADQAFAGSDFWFSELGLDFLSWPGQRMLRQNPPPMKKGRSCRILESTNSSGTGHARVKSWIDAEYHGILLADAYDRAGELHKRFEIGSVEKIDGVWLLKDMEIIDEKRGTKTKLEFELKAGK